MDYEPISALLRFAFLGLLFLFLMWLTTSARKDLTRLRDAPAAASGKTGFRDAWLVVEQSSNLSPGTRFDLFNGLTLGRSAEADVSFKDRYASGLHARLYPYEGRFLLEDLNSTNGTLVNRRQVIGQVEVDDASLIQIGDTVFRVEMD